MVKKSKIAFVLSSLGHPLVTVSVFTLIALFRFETQENARLYSALIVGGVLLPLAIKMYLGVKKGTYSNFDVSNQQERKGWYKYALLLLAILTGVLWMTAVSDGVRLSVSCALLLLAGSQLLNHYIKASLHVSVNTFLAFLMLPLNWVIALIFASFIPFIAWARVVQGRHSSREVWAGAFLGVVVGVVFLILG